MLDGQEEGAIQTAVTVCGMLNVETIFSCRLKHLNKIVTMELSVVSLPVVTVTAMFHLMFQETTVYTFELHRCHCCCNVRAE